MLEDMCIAVQELSTVKFQVRKSKGKKKKKKKKKKKCFRPGSNRGPCACEAHVITTTLRKPLDIMGFFYTFFFLYSLLRCGNPTLMDLLISNYQEHG